MDESPVMNELETAAKELTAALERFVRASLRQAAPPPEFYTSRELPPDVPSRRRFHEIVSDMSTATKRGRVWIVPRADWHARRAKKADPLEVEADRLIAQAGFRATRAA